MPYTIQYSHNDVSDSTSFCVDSIYLMEIVGKIEIKPGTDRDSWNLINDKGNTIALLYASKVQKE